MHLLNRCYICRSLYTDTSLLAVSSKVNSSKRHVWLKRDKQNEDFLCLLSVATWFNFILLDYPICKPCLLYLRFRNTSPLLQPNVVQMIANLPHSPFAECFSLARLLMIESDGPIQVLHVQQRERCCSHFDQSLAFVHTQMCMSLLGSKTFLSIDWPSPPHCPLLPLTIISVSPIHGLIPQWQLLFH